MYIPVVVSYQDELATSIKASEAITGKKNTQQRKLLGDIVALAEKALSLADKLDAAIEKGDAAKTKAAMTALRSPIDELEGLTPEDLWPVPTYAEMLFMY